MSSSRRIVKIIHEAAVHTHQRIL